MGSAQESLAGTTVHKKKRRRNYQFPPSPFATVSLPFAAVVSVVCLTGVRYPGWLTSFFLSLQRSSFTAFYSSYLCLSYPTDLYHIDLA
jgi:hypothetical protein